MCKVKFINPPNYKKNNREYVALGNKKIIYFDKVFDELELSPELSFLKNSMILGGG
jgi:hypothetical protein